MKSRRVFDAMAWGGVILIGLLQMNHVRAGFVTSYGADIVCPALLYALTRRGTTIPFNWLRVRPQPVVAVVSVLAPCFVWEYLQRYDFSGTPLVITRGHFDPGDLFAYAAGVVAMLALDLVSLRTGSVLLAPVFEREIKTRSAGTNQPAA